MNNVKELLDTEYTNINVNAHTTYNRKMNKLKLKLKLYEGDCLDALKQMPPESVDLIVTDPPYGIKFMNKEWDSFNDVTDIHNSGAYGKEKGFQVLPRQNSNYMIEFFTPIWEAALRVLKPGGFAFVMSSPRADVMARQIIALENAGFNVEYTPIFWTYLNGFPKGQNISKAVDRKLGYARDVISGTTKSPEYAGKFDMKASTERQQLGAPVSEEAKQLDGAYGGFAPKPALEPVIVAMKPLKESTYLEQALSNGKGITWLDNGRIPFSTDGKPVPRISMVPSTNSPHPNDHESRGDGSLGSYRKDREDWESDIRGRFPANLLVSDDALNNGEIIASGNAYHEPTMRNAHPENIFNLGFAQHPFMQSAPNVYGDVGSLSRYFDLDAWWSERLKELPNSVRETFPFLYVPKPSISEKDAGIYEDDEPDEKSALIGVNDVPMNPRGKHKNKHPTVKPIKLMSYLITIGSRPGDVVLDPFSGSGTTLIAAKIMGRNGVGIEKQTEYVKIIQSRLNWGNALDVEDWEYNKVSNNEVINTENKTGSLKGAVEEL